PEPPTALCGPTVDQLRQDFWAVGACKCDTRKALDFPTLRFGTRGSEVQILSPRPPSKSCPSLVYATFSDFIATTFCGPMWTNSKPRPMRSAHCCRNATSSLSLE